jgi:ketosteroid isomerase-like protein
VTDIRTVTSLVWRRTPDGWRIVREHNSTTVLPPGHLDLATS